MAGAVTALVLAELSACESAAVIDCRRTPSAADCQPDASSPAEAGAPPDAALLAACDAMPTLPVCAPDCERRPETPACRDAAAADAALGPDAAARDASEPDLGPTDAGPADLGPPDLGPPDLGPRDAAALDAGPLDAGGPCPTGTPCSCTPNTRIGCGAGDHCVLIYASDGGAAGTRCVTQGMTIAGLACDRDEPRCFRGFQCAHNYMLDVVCLNLCETTADCGLGLVCTPEPVYGWAEVDGRRYGVCLPPVP